MRSSLAVTSLVLVCVALGGMGSLARAEAEPASGTAEDLAYGEVLFHFFQDDYFAALIRLLAAEQRGELPSRARDADLLLGGLYLSYGEHNLAGQVFEQLLGTSVDPQLHDRAWFFLAKVWQQRGYHDEAEAALGRIRGELSGELAAEHRLLRAEVLMERGRFDEALNHLEAWEGPQDEWVGYARYNIGVALVRLGRIDEGARVLAEVGALEASSPELVALRDKANLALGYAWLQAGRPLEAKPSLQRVRVNGPYSNKALLGVGWADAELGDYQAALAPWVALRRRDLLDAAVQESLLAVPYAFAELGAQKQAADYYVDAIEAFEDEIARLDASIEAINRGELIDGLLDGESADGSGWYWRLDGIPDSTESRYLYELMATNHFQEGLKAYRDLVSLDDNLDRWAESLSIFDDILDTRQRAYEQRLPVIEASFERIDLDGLERRRAELESQLLEIERSEDAVALGTIEQQQQWRRLEDMERKLELLGGDARTPEWREKQRFLQGLLEWDLSRDYRARLWARQKDLRELDREIKEARRSRLEIEKVRNEWPGQFAELSARVGMLQPRVAALRAASEATLAKQRSLLQGIAVEELQAQRARLSTYRLQARFALASIYDRAAANAGPGAEPVVAEQRP